MVGVVEGAVQAQRSCMRTTEAGAYSCMFGWCVHGPKASGRPVGKARNAYSANPHPKPAAPMATLPSGCMLRGCRAAFADSHFRGRAYASCAWLVGVVVCLYLCGVGSACEIRSPPSISPVSPPGATPCDRWAPYLHGNEDGHHPES